MGNPKQNKNGKQEAALSEEQLGKLDQFFTNYQLEQNKKNLWELFSGWTYHTCESGDAEAIALMLMFYEQLVELMEIWRSLQLNANQRNNP